MAKAKKIPLKTKDCETCKSSPVEVDFKVPRDGKGKEKFFEGKRCKECMKILSYKKI